MENEGVPKGAEDIVLDFLPVGWNWDKSFTVDCGRVERREVRCFSLPR